MNARALRELLAGRTTGAAGEAPARSATPLSLLPTASLLAPLLFFGPVFPLTPAQAIENAAQTVVGNDAQGATLPPAATATAQKRTGKSAAAPTKRATQTEQQERAARQTASAKAVAAEATRDQAKRFTPRRLDLNVARQESFETGAVQQADVTPDGKWLAYTRLSGGYAELWLRGLDPGSGALPRRLAPGLADRLSPALSPDGRRIAFVGLDDDVKGDIYLLDLTRPDAAPTRLTGRDAEDGAPAFSPDGGTLYFHQRLPGENARRIVAVDVSGAAPASLHVVSTGGDAAEPALSPDGKRLAFVSTRGGPSAVYVMDLPSGAPHKLTDTATDAAGAESSPRFGPDGHTVCFTLAPAASAAGKMRSVIAAADAARPGGSARRLTSARDADMEPVIAGSGQDARLYFLSAPNGPANLWSLPTTGEIPERPAPALAKLADTLAGQTPVDRQLTILAYSRTAEAAQTASAAAMATAARYAAGRQYELLGLPEQALAEHRAAAALGVEPQAGYARIRAILIEEADARGKAVNDAGRAGALGHALSALSTLRSSGASDASVPVQTGLERARLLMTQGGAASIMNAIRLLDAELSAPGATPEQAAEALFLKAEAYDRIGQLQAVLPLYAKVIREHPEDGRWADQAVARVLDQSVRDAGEKPEDRARALMLVAEHYRGDLPKLSLGAQNRLGDVYYAADEWAKAKDAYRQTIEAARGKEKVATQLAAARLALAEILYKEERFHQALDLYETEMADRPYEDRLYRLAKAAHLRKSVAAGDYLLRIGEVPSARAIFGSLLRDDPDFVPAHRGMIRAAAAMGTIPATLADYRAQLARKPDDASLLYATGLTLTYEDGKGPLMEARGLIERAIAKDGQVEYFHQTIGYIDEVLETVHHESGRLEAALTSYERARILDARDQNPENAANLDLNIGNAHFLLGQYDAAFEAYQRRAASTVAFDNPETEIVFYQRYGAAAFQAREPKTPIEAYAKALALVEQRMDPKYASEVFGRMGKFVFDRVLTPAMGGGTNAQNDGGESGGGNEQNGRDGLAEQAKVIAARQSELNNALFEASIKPVGAPPDPAWKTYSATVSSLLAEQERIDHDLPPLMGANADAYGQNLTAMAANVRQALGFPPRFAQLRAELNDRLGLAYQEAERWREAHDCFQKALDLNTALGLTKNLAANQRSVAHAAYMQAGLTTGEDRDRLLEEAEAGFRRVPELVDRYGVADKRGNTRGGGLINLSFDVAVDKGAASQAAYGFSPAQEKRLAETFLSRIATERGRPREALGLVTRQSAKFEKGDVAPQDVFGAALLLHRAGLLENALGRDDAAFARFARSAELALELNNPVSAARNVEDMARTLAVRSPATKDFAARAAELRHMEDATDRALRRAAPGAASFDFPAFQNIMAAHDMALADSIGRDAPVDATKAALAMDALSRAGQRVAEGLRWFTEHPAANHGAATRQALALNAALRLNEAALSLRLGEDGRRAESLRSALDLADRGLLPDVRWRALAGLGSLPEALAQVEALPPDAMGCGPGEITDAFAPLVARLMDAGKVEDAFNLSERLAELERVGRMSRLGAPEPAGAELNLLRRSGLRVLALRDLRARLSQLPKNADDARLDLTRRIAQEEEILKGDLGARREFLPAVARLGASDAEQDWLLMLHGLSAELAATADAASAAGDAPNGAELRRRHSELAQRLAALKAEAARTLGGQSAPGGPGLLLAAPAQAMDLMDALPKGTSALRVVLLPGGRWAGFRLDADAIHSVELGRGTRPALPAAKPGEKRLLLVADPSILAPADLRGAAAIGFSGTHMRRSLAARKPFRRNLVFVSADKTLPVAPPAFAVKNVAPDSPKLPEAVADAHTLVADAPVRTAETAPSRRDEPPARFVVLAAPNGEPRDLAALAANLEDASLAVLPSADADDLPLTAQLLSLYGVPSVLAGPGAGASKPFVEPFLAAYAEAPASGARATALATEKPDAAPWLLIGDPGLSAAEAKNFAAARFAIYVRSGVAAYKAGQAEQALTQFENALRVARADAPGGQFARHLPDLLAYGRESAYAAGRYDRALTFAAELAADIGKRSPDTAAHAEALLRLGLVQARLERYAEAVPNLERSAEMLANLELAPKQIEALSSLGAVLENSVQYGKALGSFEGAAKLSQKTGARELAARQFMSIGRIRDMRLAQYATAKAAYGQALRIYTELNRPAERAEALLNIGRCDRLLGDFPAAEAKYAEALTLAGKNAEGERLRDRIVIEQANDAWFQARYQRAFDLTRQVLGSAEKHGWALEQEIARNTNGLLWWSLGDHERALREFDAALPLAEGLRIRQDEVATTLNNRGLVQRDMGKGGDALKTLDKALAIDRTLGSPWAIAYDLRNIAQTHARMGAPKKALPLLDEALSIVAATGDRVNETKILLARGEAELTTGANTKAGADFSRAEGLARQMDLRDGLWRALHGRARLSLAAGRKPEARKLLEEAAGVIEAMRAELKVDQLKDGFIADKTVVYEDLVTVQADLGDTAESFRTAERSRARNLIDLLGNRKRDPKRPEERAMYERIDMLRARMGEQEALLAHAQSPAEREVYGRAAKQAADEYRDALLDLQARRPDIASLVSVKPLSLSETQKLLEPGMGLLTYYVTGSEVFCWVVTPDKVALSRTRIGRGALDADILTYRRMLQNLEPAETYSKRLYDLLVAPALPALTGVSTLGVVPHGSLHTLSFATLFDGSDYLLDRYPLFELPSASVYRFTLSRRKAVRNTRVLAVGNPDLRDPSMELPFAEREVAAMAWNYPGMTVLTHERATRDWISAHIGEFGVIHMAAHGEFDPVNPLFSALKLAGDKKEKDGDLSAAEVFDLNINADLIVLSACQTGLGKVTEGDEVQGLNQAFLYAGTHALVSSLWRVSDISTAMLMKQFYREYQTRSKAESLRRAMLHVKTRFPHPGYWGAFTLTGDYK